MHIFYNTFFSIYMLRVKEENYYRTNDLFPLLFSLTHSGFLNHFYERLYCFQSDILTRVICTFRGPMKVELVWSPCLFSLRSIFIVFASLCSSSFIKLYTPLRKVHLSNKCSLINWLHETHSLLIYAPLSLYILPLKFLTPWMICFSAEHLHVTSQPWLDQPGRSDPSL